MKKKLCIYILLTICFMLVGCKDKEIIEENASNNNIIKYSKYKVADITYEVPESWNMVVDENGNAESNGLPNASFSVMVTDKVSSDHFEYFGEVFMIDNFKNMNYTKVNSYEKNTYISYKAYDYTAETLIKGEKSVVKATAISVNNKAIVFLLVYPENLSEYEDIYEHLTNSLK